MAIEGLMNDSGYKITECQEESSCGHCGCKECIWYDDFLDAEEGEE